MNSPGQLKLTLCSLRSNVNIRNLSMHVTISVGNSLREKSSSKKCANGRVSIFWNQTFTISLPGGEAVQLELKSKDSFLGPSQVVGSVILEVPDNPEALIDRWLPLIDHRSNGSNCGDLHCMFRFYPFESGVVVRPPSHLDTNDTPMLSTFDSLKSSKFPNKFKPPPPFGKSTNAQRKSITDDSSVQVHLIPEEQSGSKKSELNNICSAKSVEHLIRDLDDVKSAIDPQQSTSSSREESMTHDTTRQKKLRLVQGKVDKIRTQIDADRSLSPKLKANLTQTAEIHSKETSNLLSDKTWKDTNTSKNTFDLYERPSTALPVPHHLVKTKNFSIEDEDMFDNLVDTGYCVKVLKNGSTDRAAIVKHPESVVMIDYIAFVWDSSTTLAVSYESSHDNGKPLKFATNDSKVPLGLRLGIEGQGVGTEFSICISPYLGYGEKGRDNVPPNSHIIYEGKILSVEKSPQSPSIDEAGTATIEDEPLKHQRPLSVRFPGRRNRISIQVDEINLQEPTVQNLQQIIESPSPKNKTSRNTFVGSKTSKVPPPLPPRIFNYKKSTTPPKSVPHRPSNLKMSAAHVNSKEEISPLDLAAKMIDLDIEDSKSEPNTIKDWLKLNGFDFFTNAFHEIGVEQFTDLEHIELKDLEKMGMRVIQIRKFSAQIDGLGIKNPIKWRDDC